MIERWVLKKYILFVRLSTTATAIVKGERTYMKKNESGFGWNGPSQDLFRGQLASVVRLFIY